MMAMFGGSEPSGPVTETTFGPATTFPPITPVNVTPPFVDRFIWNVVSDAEPWVALNDTLNGCPGMTTCPAVGVTTDTVGGLFATPVPVSDRLKLGVVGSLLAITSVSDFAPAEVGLKFTVMPALVDCAATVKGAGLLGIENWLLAPACNVRAVTFRGALPKLLTKNCRLAWLPTFTLPNSNDGGMTLIFGVAAGAPVPVTPTVMSDVQLSETVMVAVRCVVSVGVKLMVTLKDWPAFIVSGNVIALRLKNDPD